MPWWQESNVERSLLGYLVKAGWTLQKPPRYVRVDVFASKIYDRQSYTLLAEVKGDVVNPNYNPAPQRNKYVQIAMGQLIFRTGPEQCGWDNNTILGLAFPDPCKDQTHFFTNYYRDRLDERISDSLKLCLFTVNVSNQVTIRHPKSVPAGLFR